MNLIYVLGGVGFSLLFLVVLFVPLEKTFPAKAGQKFLRPEWWTDLFFFLGQYLIWGGLVLWLLTYFGSWLDGIVPATFRASVAAQAWWLQGLEVVVLSDFCIYWAHRLQHRVGWLWRFYTIFLN